MSVDLLFQNLGSVVLLRAESDHGQDWLDKNVDADGLQWAGGSIAVEPRYASAIATGAHRDGLAITIS